MNKTIQVKSSSSNEIYDVDFEISDNEIKINCNCKAGSLKMMCKHRLNLLDGDISSINRPSDVKILKEILSKIDRDKIDRLFTNLHTLEKEIKRLNREKSNLKKGIGFKFSNGF